jgi:hypothetical protein
MPNQTESPRNVAFLISEGNGQISRENIILAAHQQPINAGTVLGKITTTGEYTNWDPAGRDGIENAVAVLLYDANSDTGQAAVIHRLAEVDRAQMDFGAATEAEITQAISDLAVEFIIVR